MELESISEDICSKYQKYMKNVFAQKGKLNLKLSIKRDIDGDELEELTSKNCLEYEYRSKLILNMMLQNHGKSVLFRFIITKDIEKVVA